MKKLGIKNLKKVQLWTLVKFVQVMNECDNTIKGMVFESKIVMSDTESYHFKQNDDSSISVTYTNENPSLDYSFVKIQGLYTINIDEQTLDCASILLEVFHREQCEPIMNIISGEELFLYISTLANNIATEEPIEGLRTSRLDENVYRELENEDGKLIEIVNSNVESFILGEKSDPLFNHKLWAYFFSGDTTLKVEYIEYLINVLTDNLCFYREGIDSDNFDDGVYFIKKAIEVIGGEDEFVKWCHENNYELNELYYCFRIIYENILKDIFKV